MATIDEILEPVMGRPINAETVATAMALLDSAVFDWEGHAYSVDSVEPMLSTTDVRLLITVDNGAGVFEARLGVIEEPIPLDERMRLIQRSKTQPVTITGEPAPIPFEGVKVRVPFQTLPDLDEMIRLGLLDDMPDFSEEPMAITGNHFTNSDGKPDGGVTQGPGFVISWQRGPLVGDDVTAEECVHGHEPLDLHSVRTTPHAGLPCRRAQNGAFVEEVIEAAIDRITHYEMDTPFGCDENRQAIEHLNAALTTLRSRTQRRRTEGLEGTSTPGPGDDGEPPTQHNEHGHLIAVGDPLRPLTATQTCSHCGEGIAHVDDEHPEDESKWVHVRQELPLRPCIVEGRQIGTSAFPLGMQGVSGYRG